MQGKRGQKNGSTWTWRARPWSRRSRSLRREEAARRRLHDTRQSKPVQPSIKLKQGVSMGFLVGAVPDLGVENQPLSLVQRIPPSKLPKSRWPRNPSWHTLDRAPNSRAEMRRFIAAAVARGARNPTEWAHKP